MSYKIHKSLVREFKDKSIWTGTLCGRLSSKTDDGYMNVADKDSEITCKLCLQKLQNVTNRGKK